MVALVALLAQRLALARRTKAQTVVLGQLKALPSQAQVVVVRVKLENNAPAIQPVWVVTASVLQLREQALLEVVVVRVPQVAQALSQVVLVVVATVRGLATLPQLAETERQIPGVVVAEAADQTLSLTPFKVTEALEALAL